MIHVARAKLANERPRSRTVFVRGDMARFALHRRFGLIVIPYRAFQHLLTAAKQRGCLECARRHLRRDGRLIIHLFDPRLDLCLPKRQRALMNRSAVRDPKTGHEVDILVDDRRNNPLTQTFRETWKWIERDRHGAIINEARDVLWLRWTYRQEMAYLFELTGFEVQAAYSDFFGAPPRYGAEQIWAVTMR